MLMIGMYCIQEVNERFIGLTWALCRLGQVVEHLKTGLGVYQGSVQYMAKLLLLWCGCCVNDWYI